MPTRHVAMFSGNQVAIIILLALVGGAWFLIVNQGKPTWTIYESPRIQKNWNLENTKNNCSFEEYVFGQPIKQDDPCLVTAFKEKFLWPPPHPSTVLHYDEKQFPSNIEKFNWVKKLLHEGVPASSSGKESKGFFIECGANDGKFLSSTIRVEKELNWTGLLIEAHPTPFGSLLKLKRNAWAANVVLCITPHPQQVTYYSSDGPSDYGGTGLKRRPEDRITVNLTLQCIPLYTILKALDVETVDYLNLDVEGSELDILKTIPFDKIRFKMLTVEYLHIPGGLKPLTEFLESKGYRLVKEIIDGFTKDGFYVHESLYELASKIKQTISNRS